MPPQVKLSQVYFKMTEKTQTSNQIDSVDGSVISEYGKQNIFAKEAPMQLQDSYTNYPQEAEKANGRWAMIGIIALFGAYLSTGQIIPGIY